MFLYARTKTRRRLYIEDNNDSAAVPSQQLYTNRL